MFREAQELYKRAVLGSVALQLLSWRDIVQHGLPTQRHPLNLASEVKVSVLSHSESCSTSLMSFYIVFLSGSEAKGAEIGNKMLVASHKLFTIIMHSPKTMIISNRFAYVVSGTV